MTIKLSNLYKKFGDTVVLDDVSLEIEPGDVIALIGASGAGKSTFLRSINYLEVPDSGHVDIDDLHLDFANINKDDILNLRRKTAMVFQQFNLFERRTALENVMEGLIQVKKIDKVTAAEQAAQELIKVGLSDRMAYYPKFLSGGQKQRVGIARALAMKPALLLLDEPTSALDPELVSEVQASIIQAAKSGQTMIIVSHEMDFVIM
jgi:amino acid ABC transporter ATP-binding protein, PAAT family (TC 3.A.1.3.-)